MKPLEKNFFGTRLKLARKMAGMSLQNLSDNLGNLITKQSLNKYEQGLMKPTSDVLIAISKALNVKPDFFLKKDVPIIQNISFRKKASFSKKIEESIVEKSRDYVERFFEIENILGIEIEFRNPLENISINNKKDVETAAEKLRDDWDLGSNPISGIIELFEIKGIKALLVEIEDGIDGFSYITSNLVPVVVINTSLKPIERIRFTIIHELAHLLLRFNDKIKSDHKLMEKLCHYFASCFLIPSVKLTEMIGGKKRNYISIKELIVIKEYYGISIRATVHRLREMEIIIPSYYQRWMIYMSKKYGQKNEPGNYKGEEKTKHLEYLVNRALSEELITISKAAILLNTDIEKLRKGEFGV